MLSSSRVTVRVGVRYSVLLVSGCAHVFVLLSVVIVLLPMFLQKQEFDIYTTYCLKKTSAESCLDELGGDQNPFLKARTCHSL